MISEVANDDLSTMVGAEQGKGLAFAITQTAARAIGGEEAPVHAETLSVPATKVESTPPPPHFGDR